MNTGAEWTPVEEEPEKREPYCEGCEFERRCPFQGHSCMKVPKAELREREARRIFEMQEENHDG